MLRNQFFIPKVAMYSKAEIKKSDSKLQSARLTCRFLIDCSKKLGRVEKFSLSPQKSCNCLLLPAVECELCFFAFLSTLDY